MSEGILTATDSEFQTQVLDAEQPTLVDFWAEWCAPCRALTPVVEEIAADYQGRLQVAKMNIDEHPQVPTQYAVRAIPTLLLFKEGKVVDQLVGLVTKARLEEMITRHL
ncbi:MAG: thioredoxin [Deltaproteobacteria bacterium RIFOXYA12_FULL_58_15]|nr:MAG: thioredoxin [Deltaproteobacteria bacterium RIFOXYA12_FULL_58_15]OGR08453.1 MAG: thioredoxin [Deltaproteobacteria bacterium RIFOXYB12_FULL_58_9]